MCWSGVARPEGIACALRHSGNAMATILPFLNGGVFGPTDITAMSMAFDDVCKALNVRDTDGRTREVVAVRFIELATRGERSPISLRDRVLREANADGQGRAA
jgi:hypothetical protein